ncbi:MAG: pseudaminic acid biosynthesis-associated methylase [Clostridiales bacterium]
MSNLQEKLWKDKFGSEYTDENMFNPFSLNNNYKEKYGITREELNFRFIAGLNIMEGNILEIGCNVGSQLNLLQKMGFKRLYGIEFQEYAIEKSKKFTEKINIIYGLADDSPFKDNYFDLVFTSDLLTYIEPENIGKVMNEIHRCSNKFIWGFESYNSIYTEVNKNSEMGNKWKGNFSKIYMDKFTDLTLVKEDFYSSKDDKNKKVMYLLKKK